MTPAWKGTFWPTVISASSLSLVKMCGVESTLTSELFCSACITMEKAGMGKLSSSGPCRPAKKPPSWASERMPESERLLPIWLPSTATDSSPASPSSEAGAPPCSEMPKSLVFLRLTSMITASTKTWRRAMSSCSITLTKFR